MAYKVFLDKPVDKSLSKMNKEVRQKILSACVELKNFSKTSRKFKKLLYPYIGFRRRIGKYRILFTVENKRIEIYKIGLRRDIYKKLK